MFLLLTLQRLLARSPRTEGTYTSTLLYLIERSWRYELGHACHVKLGKRVNNCFDLIFIGSIYKYISKFFSVVGSSKKKKLTLKVPIILAL